MTRRQRQQFMKWVAEEIVEKYSVSIELATEMVEKSWVDGKRARECRAEWCPLMEK